MNKQILLVATANDVVQAVPITLGLAGHSVAIADRGLEAIRQARETSPDLIVIDAILPDMDGVTLVDILRRLPSTSELRTMLLKARRSQGLSSAEPECPRLNSSELLAQIGHALELCREPLAPALEAEKSSTSIV